MPQPCNSRKLVLTLERATESVFAISSACSGLGETNRSACTWATVRLMPQRVPISPQCRTKRCSIDERAISVVRKFCTNRNYRTKKKESSETDLDWKPGSAPDGGLL